MTERSANHVTHRAVICQPVVSQSSWPVRLPQELYCIEGVVTAAQCTATVSKSIVLPRIWALGREYAD